MNGTKTILEHDYRMPLGQVDGSNEKVQRRRPTLLRRLSRRHKIDGRTLVDDGAFGRSAVGER